MSSSATGVGMPICFLGAILLILTQKSSQKFGDVLGILYICLGANRINRSIDNILHKQDILRQICFYIQIQTLQIHTGSVNLIDKYNCRDLQLL